MWDEANHADTREDCVFCRIANKQVPAHTLDETDEVIVFHFHLHVYPCWEGKEGRAVSRFVGTVTDRPNVTEQMKAATRDRIRGALAGR